LKEQILVETEGGKYMKVGREEHEAEGENSSIKY
jgi:hypothetical protein